MGRSVAAGRSFWKANNCLGSSGSLALLGLVFLFFQNLEQLALLNFLDVSEAWDGVGLELLGALFHSDFRGLSGGLHMEERASNAFGFLKIHLGYLDLPLGSISLGHDDGSRLHFTLGSKDLANWKQFQLPFGKSLVGKDTTKLGGKGHTSIFKLVP